jgi:hypothetical protein
MLACYPNPAYDKIMVQTRAKGICSLVITSMTGQQIKSIHFTGGSHTIDLSSYRKGVYFITVRSEGYDATRRFIKL